MPDPVISVPFGAQPFWPPGLPPAPAGTGLQVQRPELVDTSDATVGQRVVVEVQDSRKIQRKHSVSYRTVQQALTSAWPTVHKEYTPRPSKLEPFQLIIDAILLADLDAPPKQRHTLTRPYQRLIDEHGVTEVSYPAIGRHVRQRRPEVLVATGRAPSKVFISQTHRPGEKAEVDFGDITIRLRGELVICYLFCFRRSFSGRAVHRASLLADQEAFFEGHLHAVQTLGGVLTKQVRYDNLRAAVSQVLGFTRARVEAERWTVFRSRLGLQPFYC